MKMIVVEFKRAEYNYYNRNEEPIKEKYEIVDEEQDVEFEEEKKAS